MADRLYSQAEVNKIFSHIPSKTLLYWTQYGLLRWSEETRDGRGVHRKFSKKDLYLIGLVEELTSLNLSLFTIKLITSKEITGHPVHQDLVENMGKFLMIWKIIPGREDWGQAGAIQFAIASHEEMKKRIASMETAPPTNASALTILVNLSVITYQVDHYVDYYIEKGGK